MPQLDAKLQNVNIFTGFGSHNVQNIMLFHLKHWKMKMHDKLGLEWLSDSTVSDTAAYD